MKKTICCIGSSGFIGRHIYSEIKKNADYEIFRYSSKNNKFIDKCELDKFDYLIFSAGIHSQSENDEKNIFIETKKILRNTKDLFLKSNSIIFLSSFKTSFNTDEKIIKSTNRYNYFKFDNYYGKSKIISEKIFIKFCKNFKKKYVIISPSHVIGPGDYDLSANGKFFKNILNKKLIFIPHCKISIVDVRNLSKKIVDLISKDEFNNKKLIINDFSILLEEYVKMIKSDQNHYFVFKINLFLVNIFFVLNKLLLASGFTKRSIISRNRLNYIKLNPSTEIIDKNKKFSVKETIDDTKLFFS
tara:strand:- start:1449 stop:2351 length:903 start_codon:yes stop_codon:yes gene_type:complete